MARWDLSLVVLVALVALGGCQPRTARVEASPVDGQAPSAAVPPGAPSQALEARPLPTDATSDAPLPAARIHTFKEAKHLLRVIYAREHHEIDLYCGCRYRGTAVDLVSCGYRVQHDERRAHRIEWEHVVPAHRFGQSFPEWRDGSSDCVDARGRHFRGRKCARRASEEFSRIEADMHNLFPVIGEVNGLRSDYPMALVAGDPSEFGACAIQIEHKTFEPRPSVRGDLARAYLYMERAYPQRVKLSPDERTRFRSWSAADPPDAWERRRNALVAEVFGRRNPLIAP